MVGMPLVVMALGASRRARVKIWPARRHGLVARRPSGGRPEVVKHHIKQTNHVLINPCSKTLCNPRPGLEVLGHFGAPSYVLYDFAL